MENASRALLMAGGMLLVMLVIALLIYAWGTFSDFYSNSDELSDIEDLTEFNLQFTNYDRSDVMGYELLSLINKIIDYNARFSTAGTNDNGYAPITIVVSFSTNGFTNIAYDVNSAQLFTATNKIYTQSGTSSAWSNITNTLSNLESQYGKENLQNLSKSIDSIFTTNYNAQYRTEKFLSIVSTTGMDSTRTTKYNAIKAYADAGNYTRAVSSTYIGSFESATKKYYEYTQFKKAIFSCTSVSYNTTTGRVSQMNFEYTGKVE